MKAKVLELTSKERFIKKGIKTIVFSINDSLLQPKF